MEKRRLGPFSRSLQPVSPPDSSRPAGDLARTPRLESANYSVPSQGEKAEPVCGKPRLRRFHLAGPLWGATSQAFTQASTLRRS